MAAVREEEEEARVMVEGTGDGQGGPTRTGW
jgi:hypothetical protein